jgi:hypothetical protein
MKKLLLIAIMAILLSACKTETATFSKNQQVRHRRYKQYFTIDSAYTDGRQVFYKATRSDGQRYNRLAQNSIKAK